MNKSLLEIVIGQASGVDAISALKEKYIISSNGNRITLEYPDGSGKIHLFSFDEVIQAAHKRVRHHLNSGSTSAYQTPHDSIVQSDGAPATLAAALAIIEEQKEKILRLKRAGKVVIEQRDHWKAQAEMTLEKLRHKADGNAVDRYAVLKRFLARKFHPDHTQSEGFERLMRAEIFKEIWTEIDRIEKDE